MNTYEAINMKDIYKNTKQRIYLEVKPIKKLLLYNYINDDILSMIIDCRNLESIQIPEIPNQNRLSLRLIIIIDEKVDLKIEPKLETLRKYITEHDEINKGLFQITSTNYSEFIKDYSYLYSTNFTSINNFHLPLCLLNGIIYFGGFINSKNKKNLSLLKPKTVVSFMKEDDKDLLEMFGNINYRNFVNDESAHDELEFNEINDYLLEQINNKQIPILCFCFSGKSVCLAAMAAFLMKFKNWPLQFAVGYILKLSPCLDLPSWLFTQLQRWDIKK